VKEILKSPKPHEVQISISDFLKSFNQNMPEGFPQVTEEQLLRFKKEHLSFFKHGDSWSLDLHRKKIIDWLPQNNKVIV